MDILTHKINDAIQDESLHIAVRAAAARGRVILDKYYSKTDQSIMYRMAMSTSHTVSHLILVTYHGHDEVLHPQYKTDYFVDEEWEEEWIVAARDIITERWNTFYRDNDVVQDDQAAVSDSSLD